MRKSAARLASAALLVGGLVAMASPAAAVTVVFNDGSGGLAPGETLIQDFNSGVSGATNVSNAGIYASSQDGVAAEPATGDQGDPFFAVLGGGTADFNFANPLNEFSFDYGSADTYNSLTVFFAGGGSQTFTGQQLIDSGVADGNQTAARTNGRLIVHGDGQSFTGIRLSSSQNSLELDNIAGSAVPEPATWAMMLFGFGAVGFGMRRRRNKVQQRIRYAF